MDSESPRLYVVCPSASSKGETHGRWIRADCGFVHFEKEVAKLLLESPESDGEEWVIRAYEGFCGAEVGDHDSYFYIAGLGEFIAEHGRLGAAVYNRSCDVEEARDILKNKYCGKHESAVAWAKQYLAKSLSGPPHDLDLYFNFKLWVEVQFFLGELWTVKIDGMVHVFHG